MLVDHIPFILGLANPQCYFQNLHLLRRSSFLPSVNPNLWVITTFAWRNPLPLPVSADLASAQLPTSTKFPAPAPFLSVPPDSRAIVRQLPSQRPMESRGRVRQRKNNKPPMTGVGWNITHKNADDLGMVYFSLALQHSWQGAIYRLKTAFAAKIGYVSKNSCPKRSSLRISRKKSQNRRRPETFFATKSRGVWKWDDDDQPSIELPSGDCCSLLKPWPSRNRWFTRLNGDFP